MAGMSAAGTAGASSAMADSAAAAAAGRAPTARCGWRTAPRAGTGHADGLPWWAGGRGRCGAGTTQPLLTVLLATVLVAHRSRTAGSAARPNRGAAAASVAAWTTRCRYADPLLVRPRRSRALQHR